MTTPNLGLTEYPTGVLTPSVPFNESMQALDALVGPRVIVQDKDLTTPPTTVSGDVGKRWIVAAGATGAWASKDNQIALCTAATEWRFFVPAAGWRAEPLDEAPDTYRYNGSAWVIEAGGTSDAAELAIAALASGAFLDPTTTDYDLIVRKVTAVSALGVGFIGDSITAGTLVTTAPPDIFETEAATAGITITATNNGVSGATSADWIPAAGNYTTAKAAFLAAGVRLVHIMLGTNDSKTAVATSQAAYRANLLSTCLDLIDAGFLVALSYPPFLNTTTGVFDAASPGRVASYCAAVDSLIDNQHIFRGDTLGYAYFEANTSALQGDGVHPTQAGSDYLAGLWTDAVRPIVAGLTNQTVFQRCEVGSGLTISNVAGVETLAATGGGGSGDVVGPASATADAVALYDGTTGKLIKNGSTIAEIRSIPQNSQSAAYTAVLADAGKHLLHPSADTTARIFTIPANSSVAYPIGTALTFVNQNGAGVVTIAITTDTMRLAGAGTTGSRTLAANGVATALKLTSTEWIISGTGLT